MSQLLISQLSRQQFVHVLHRTPYCLMEIKQIDQRLEMLSGMSDHMHDLIVSDIFICGFLKSKVYRCNPRSLE